MRYIAGLMMLAAVMAACATPTPIGRTPVDITSTWSGSWEGYGVQKIKRHDNADARFTQQGTTGTGRVWLEGILASEFHPADRATGGRERCRGGPRDERQSGPDPRSA